MSKSIFTEEFKQGVIQYALDYPQESKVAIAKKFGIADSTVHAWMKVAKKKKNGTIISRGSGNYGSEEAKENAQLRKELKDTKDALDVLKKAIGILGK